MKKNYWSIPFVALMFCIFLYSCTSTPDSKEEFMSEYGDFIEEVKENKADYTDEDWKKMDEKFKRYSEELSKEFEGEMSLLEKGKLAKYVMQYGIARSKSTLGGDELEDAIGEIKNALNSDEVKNAIQEFKNAWNTELKHEFGTAVEELEGVWNDDLKNELSGSLDELKALLDDEELREELKGKLDEVKETINSKEFEGKIKSATKELQGVLQEIEQEIDKVATE
jgi:hypothetical protein